MAGQWISGTNRLVDRLLKTTNLALKEGNSSSFHVRDAGDTAFKNLKGDILSVSSAFIAESSGAYLRPPNSDNAYFGLQARENTVGSTETARLVGAAEPRFGHTLPLNLRSSSELTIATGAITAGVSGGTAWYTVDTEGDAASDDLDTINGGATGDRIIIVPQNAARTVVAKHGTGNLNLSGGVDFTMDEDDDFLELLYDGSLWQEIGRSENHA